VGEWVGFIYLHSGYRVVMEHYHHPAFVATCCVSLCQYTAGSAETTAQNGMCGEHVTPLSHEIVMERFCNLKDDDTYAMASYSNRRCAISGVILEHPYDHKFASA
jgi:hypothetical protein